MPPEDHISRFCHTGSYGFNIWILGRCNLVHSTHIKQYLPIYHLSSIYIFCMIFIYLPQKQLIWLFCLFVYFLGLFTGNSFSNYLLHSSVMMISPNHWIRWFFVCFLFFAFVFVLFLLYKELQSEDNFNPIQPPVCFYHWFPGL